MRVYIKKESSIALTRLIHMNWYYKKRNIDIKVYPTKEEIRDKTANLLFFGNFYKMDLKDFEWGINEMIKDKNYLYSSMIRDFYNLGKVLSVKYKYLRISYMIFMIGLVFSVLVFAAAFVFKSKAVKMKFTCRPDAAFSPKKLYQRRANGLSNATKISFTGAA